MFERTVQWQGFFDVTDMITPKSVALCRGLVPYMSRGIFAFYLCRIHFT